MAVVRINGRRGRFRRLEGTWLAAAYLTIGHLARNQRGQLGVARVHERVVAVGVHVALAQFRDRQCTHASGLHDVLEPQAAGAEHVLRHGTAVATGRPARQGLEILFRAGQVHVREIGRPVL